MRSPGPFGARTTLRVGGGAAEVIEVSSCSDLEAFAASLAPDRAVYVLGRGSNTLVADGGFDGTVLHLGEAFSSIEITGTRIVVGGAADLPVVARRSVEAALAGFEWAVGVPGTVGGAVAMNAGGHGSEMAASVVEVELFDLDTGAVVRWGADELAFGYRRSAIGARQVVLSATLELQPGEVEVGRLALREVVRWRREHQPGGANCGSVFTNPQGESAGRLLDSVGAKGRRHRSAAVSEKHANFIQADAGGAADDVVALMLELVDAVAAATEIHLRSEVRLVGVAPSIVALLHPEGR